MLEIGRARYPDIDFRLEDCSQHQTVDTLGLDGTVNAFHRVLKSNAVDIFIFLTSLLIPLDITSVLFIETRAKDNWCRG